MPNPAPKGATMRKLALAAAVAAHVTGCATPPEPPQAAPTTRAPATTRAAPSTSHVSDNPDFQTGDTIQVIVNDYDAGRVDGHTGLNSVRLTLETMEALDCDRFSTTIAREMPNMDAALRSAGY